MRILIGVVMAAALGATAATAAATAQSARLSDVAFMQAGRCLGLASSAKMAQADKAGFKALVESQSSGRDPYVLTKVDELQQQARHDADRAGDEARARLQAELNGMCATLKG